MCTHWGGGSPPLPHTKDTTYEQVAPDCSLFSLLTVAAINPSPVSVSVRLCVCASMSILVHLPVYAFVASGN